MGVIEHERLVQVLLDEKLCSTKEEAESIVDAGLEEVEEVTNGEGKQKKISDLSLWNDILVNYLDLTKEQSTLVIQKCKTPESCENGENTYQTSSLESIDELPTFDNKFYNEDEDHDDDGEVLGPGECELCERYIRLTKHHLIPKSTWPRLEVRLHHAADAIKKGNTDHKAERILGEGLIHLLPQLSTSMDRASIRRAMSQTCNICRPCHSAIHRTYDNMTLAQYYNTPERILNDPTLYKFIRWASKQRSGKYSR